MESISQKGLINREHGTKRESSEAISSISCPGSTLKCVVMNIKGLGHKLKDAVNLKTLTGCDIIMLTETWLANDTVRKRFKINGYTPHNYIRTSLHSKATRASGGCIVYFKDELSKKLVIDDNLCDHFVVVNISNVMNYDAYIIMCYIPPLDSDYICKNCDGNYMEALSDLVAKYSLKGSVSVCGDLNGRTGLLSDEPIVSDIDLTAGLFSHLAIDSPIWQTKIDDRASMDVTSNSRGEDILNLCKSTGLRIMNGRCFEDKDIGKFTFIDGNRRSVNDYLLCDEKMYTMLNWFSVGEKWVETDHCPLYFAFSGFTNQSITHSIEKSSYDKYTRFFWENDCKDEFMSCLYDNEGEENLNAFYESIYALSSVDSVSEKYSDYLLQACERSLKKSKRNVVSNKSTFPKNPWYDSECKALKREYHNARKSASSLLYGCKRSKMHTKRLSQMDSLVDKLEKDYKRLVQRKRRQFYRENLLELQNCNGQKELWQKLNKLKVKDPPSEQFSIEEFFSHFSKPPIENRDNKHDFDIVHEEEMKTFLSGRNTHVVNNDETFVLISDIMNSVVTLEEVVHAINMLKSGKSPGIDGVPIDIFKSLQNDLSPNLVILFNYILEKGVYPNSWSIGVISPVPKVPTPGAPDQFRRISVLPAICKIFENVINNRLEYVDEVFDRDDKFNGGFKKGSRTSDNLFILNGIIEKSRAMKSPLYICFVDFKRAFDCINRLLLFAKLHRDGLSSSIIDIMFDMYIKTTSRIKWKGFLSEIFKDTVGVNQGGITSPYFFKKFLKDLSDELEDDCGVIMWDRVIKHLLWADDLFLVSNSPEGLQRQMNNLHNYCKKWHMVVNTMKTKVMVVGKVKRDQSTFFFNNQMIEICDQYNYVGTTLSDKKDVFSNVQSSILQKCYRSSYKIRQYCENLGQLPPTLAVHFFKTLLVPLMDFGSEVWYSDKIADQFEIFQRKFFKRNLRVRRCTPNNALYGDLGIFPVGMNLRNNVIKFYHRIHNMSDSQPVKWVFNELKSLSACGFPTWIDKAENVYGKSFMKREMSLSQFLDLSSYKMKKKLKLFSSGHYTDDWLYDVNDTYDHPKLRTYKLFKRDFKFEPYLYIPNVKIRIALAQFRMSSHHLAIERMRFNNTPVHLRLCTECQQVEDELHHLLQCKKHSSIRTKMLDKANNIIPRFERLDDEKKFVSLMSSKDPKLLYEIGCYLVLSAKD